MRIASGLLAPCLALLLASSAAGQTTTLPVRGGEHADFTRLVIRLPEANDWRVISEGTRAQILISGPPLAFDLTQTFARIPRTRLRALRQEENALFLDLACVCDVRAAEDIPEFLVIDIVGENAAALQAPRATQRPLPRPGGAPSAPDAYSAITDRAGSGLARALREGQQTSAESGSLLLRQALGPQATSLTQIPSEPPENPLDGHGSVRQAMAEELGQALARAVGDGLLTRAPTVESFPAPDLMAPARPGVATLIQHVAITGAQRETDRARQTASYCHDSELLDVASWAEDPGLAMTGLQISDLYNDVDALHPQAAMKLVKTYIARGFGAEARLALSLVSPQPEDMPLIEAMTRLVDLAPLRDENPFPAHADCGNGGELWLFLSLPGPELPEEFDYGSLLQIVSALPPDLRLHLGPEIVERLVATGRQEEAAQVRAALDRIAGAETAPLRRARTRLDLLSALPDQAARIEAALSPEDNDDDLILLLARRETEGLNVEEHLLDLARTRLFALRGSPAGQELARLMIRAMARDGDFQQAFSLLDGRDAALPEAMREALRSEMLLGLAEDAGDSDFVTLAFAQTPWELETLSEALRDALAARLLHLGFGDQAQYLRDAAPLSVVPGTMEAPESPDVLRARLAVAARRAATPADQPDETERLQPTLEPDRDPSQAVATSASLTTEVSGQPAGGEDSLADAAGPLTRGRETLGQSADLRARLENLLSEADLPDS